MALAGVLYEDLNRHREVRMEVVERVEKEFHL